MKTENIILFTMKGCPHCDKLKKTLNEYNISFEEKDVDKNVKLYENFSKAVDSDYLPAVLIGKKAFIAERSFKTIKQAGEVIQNFLLEQDRHGNRLD